MTFLYIGNFQEVWNEEGIARALESLGHTVMRVEESRFDLDKVKLDMKDADVLLMAKFKTPVRLQAHDVIEEAKKNGVTTVSWVWDLYWGLNREKMIDSDPIFTCDYFLSPDGGNDEKWKSKGVNHHTLRQAIAEEYLYKGEYNEEYDNNVVFVGCWNQSWPYREVMESKVKEFGYRRYGYLDTNEIRGHDLNTLYASAKVVMGDSVYSQQYWSNRLYETLGRGGFSIWPKIPGLDEEYEPYEHYIPYTMNDWDGLKEKIEYFLAHPKKRRKIGDAAFQHTKDNHTLKHRCKRLVELIS